MALPILLYTVILMNFLAVKFCPSVPKVFIRPRAKTLSFSNGQLCLKESLCDFPKKRPLVDNSFHDFHSAVFATWSTTNTIAAVASVEKARRTHKMPTSC
jgi:hypothetical protein